MRDFQPQGGSGRAVGHSHEPRDLRVRIVILFGLVLSATLLGAPYALRLVFSDFRDRADRRDRPRSPLREVRAVPPEPRLQTNPGEELKALKREEDRRLGTYGWIDREQKILRMPIDRAMDQMIRRGVPVRAAARSAD
jgi:hypothetical protein